MLIAAAGKLTRTPFVDRVADNPLGKTHIPVTGLIVNWGVARCLEAIPSRNGRDPRGVPKQTG
jgi:hypothetical protein